MERLLVPSAASLVQLPATGGFSQQKRKQPGQGSWVPPHKACPLMLPSLHDVLARGAARERSNGAGREVKTSCCHQSLSLYTQTHLQRVPEKCHALAHTGTSLWELDLHPTSPSTMLKVWSAHLIALKNTLRAANEAKLQGFVPN